MQVAEDGPPPTGRSGLPAAALGVVAAAILESQRALGCSRCRFAGGGCRRCRNPEFKPRVSPGQLQQQQAPAPPAGKGGNGKRRRRAASQGAPEPLLHTLRRQLQGLHTESHGTADAAGDSGSTAGASAAAGPAPSQAHAAGPPQPQQPQQPPQQQQQLKRAAEDGSVAGQAGRPAKYLKLTSQQLPQQHAAAASKRNASTEPSPTGRRPAKRHRPGPSDQQPAVAAAAASSAHAQPAEGEQAAGAPHQPAAVAKRPAAAAEQQQAHRPAKFRKLAPPSPLQQQQQQENIQHLQQQQTQAASGGAPGSAGSGEGGGSGMDVDLVSPRKRVAAAALERAATGGGSPASAEFLSRLEQNMQQRRQERQTQGAAEPHPLALASGGKRRKGASPRSPGPSPAAGAASPAGGRGAAGEGGAPDPRLCLWEPPVSPFGLLEEELYEDPWKLLVACLLLNKTSSTQVRRVIWDLFTLCPTPAAAVAADVQRVQALIQPLGLFRKRALAIQQLSQDYLYKQWRDPSELFGIGKYAADAYHMFCRGRWRDIVPDDKDLKRYRDWLERTGGLGTGLSRHRTMPPTASQATG